MNEFYSSSVGPGSRPGRGRGHAGSDNRITDAEERACLYHFCECHCSLGPKDDYDFQHS